MKFMHLMGILAITILLQACTSSSDSGNARSQLADANYDPDRIRCKTQAVTGSRLGVRICMTNRDWNVQHEDAREAMEHIKRGTIFSPESNR
ncbi:MAG: hypothetical protein ABGY96_01130 [bacterium]|nr:hypothetical protein [Gammaproteobacteria bacterium]HIL94949.1 hypothetical protein [Pseudomonadales bacterium]